MVCESVPSHNKKNFFRYIVPHTLTKLIICVLKYYTGLMYRSEGNDMKTLRSHSGFTLMELMVTIAIMGILGGIAVPKYFDVVEKTRQKVDQTKLYHLRDALNLALIEDLDALSNYSPSKKLSDDQKKNLANKLANGLESDRGITLFVLELHNGLSINVQGKHDKANNTYNVCELVGNGGTWYNALKESGFDGVAEIIAARLQGVSSFNKNGESFNSIEYTNSSGNKDYRTAPKKPLFLSKALNHGKTNENTRYTLSVRWNGGMSESASVEVYLLPNGSSWNAAYRTDQGVCFSTMGNAGCAKSKKK